MSRQAWIESLMTDTVTIENREPTGTDEYGNVVYESVEMFNTIGLLQNQSQDELQDGRAVAGVYTLVLPASTAGMFNGFSRAYIGGVCYELSGNPAIYRGLRQTAVDHVEASVVRSSA